MVPCKTSKRGGTLWYSSLSCVTNTLPVDYHIAVIHIQSTSPKIPLGKLSVTCSRFTAGFINRPTLQIASTKHSLWHHHQLDGGIKRKCFATAILNTEVIVKPALTPSTTDRRPAREYTHRSCSILQARTCMTDIVSATATIDL